MFRAPTSSSRFPVRNMMAIQDARHGLQNNSEGESTCPGTETVFIIAEACPFWGCSGICRASREPGEGVTGALDVSRSTRGSLRSARAGGRSSEGIDRALIYAGPMTERENGLVPEQSGGTKPTDGSGNEGKKPGLYKGYVKIISRWRVTGRGKGSVRESIPIFQA